MAIINISHDLTPAFSGLRRAFDSDPAIRYFAATLLTANLALILIHVGVGASYELGWQPNPLPDLWNLSRERSIPEYLNYFQTALCAALVFICWVRTRIHARLVWALVFVFVAFDDAFGYHETVGRYVATLLPAFGSVDAGEIGELLAWIVAAAVLAVPMVAALFQQQSRTDRLSILLLVAFASLVIFAVGMDFLHEQTSGTLIGQILGTIEDGGEMLSLACASIIAFGYFRRRL